MVKITTPIQFVVNNYRKGEFDPDRGFERFRERVGLAPAGRNAWVTWRLAFVAVIVVLVAGLSLYIVSMNRWEETTASVVELPDGSIAKLREGASLAYQPHRFTRERNVRLKGMGCFEVMRNPKAPFVVRGQETFVRVLGTQFLFDTETEVVYVIDGRVLFAREVFGQGLELGKGEYAILPEGSEVPLLTAPATPNPAAWATGRLEYDAVPLGDVLEELSDLYGKRLGVAPEAASGKRLTGAFDVSDGVAFIIAAIESALNVQIAVSDE